MSDTPRTDEQINGKPCTRFEILAGDSLRNASVPSEFARKLERELNAANDRIKRIEAALRRIANQDYRGNRSTESQIAFEALKEAK